MKMVQPQILEMMRGLYRQSLTTTHLSVSFFNADVSLCSEVTPYLANCVTSIGRATFLCVVRFASKRKEVRILTDQQ